MNLCIYSLFIVVFLILLKDYLFVLVVCWNFVKYCCFLFLSCWSFFKVLVNWRIFLSFLVVFVFLLVVCLKLNNLFLIFYKVWNLNVLKVFNSWVVKLFFICLYEVRRLLRNVCCMLLVIGVVGRYI